MNKQTIQEFQEKAASLIELLNEKFDPFTKIIIDWDSAVIFNGNYRIDDEGLIFKISKE